MAFRIQQLTDDSKFSQALRFEVLEQLCPRELVSDLLTRCHAWGERERSINQLLLVYYVIALSLFRRLNLAAVLAHLVRGPGRTRRCGCRQRQRWYIVGGNWGPRSCATCFSASANRWPKSRPGGPFASACG
jgi:hypothetical protein